MYKVGDIKRFDISRSKKPYTCKEVIEDTKQPFDWETDYGKCPHCGENIKKTKSYILTNIYIFENEEDTIYLADTEDKFFLQLPDYKLRPHLDMTATVKDKGQYLKDKEKK
jgi:hypothetical protein